MQISNAGLLEIERSEGFSSRPYLDTIASPAVWTIGFGETRGVTHATGPWSRAYAEQRLKERFAQDYAPALRPFVDRTGFNQNMYDALASFIWNCGIGAVGMNTGIGRALRARKWNTAANELLKWCKAGGKIIPGLLSRRKRERALFLKKVTASPRTYLTPWERRTCAELEARRRSARRHGGWAKIDSEHLRVASKAKAELAARVRYLKDHDQNKFHRRERIRALQAVISG